MLYAKHTLNKALSHQPSLKKDVWLALKNISDEALISGGRVYGGGLHKLEPKELGNVVVDLSSIGDKLLH
ncbi:hypothetical protein NIES267_09930 [Calothrix parasitica NIES-267]|uniref:Uncharacterized protein n=1 Tax=Calothrix parasitica NIES-267 TaxID=1973488 RepID=A0A1Z4LJV6_9CYAN|nr:hypothetical protein NIES267_09930 [Calothrix parasitica NIES-267]